MRRSLSQLCLAGPSARIALALGVVFADYAGRAGSFRRDRRDHNAFERPGADGELPSRRASGWYRPLRWQVVSSARARGCAPAARQRDCVRRCSRRRRPFCGCTLRAWSAAFQPGRDWVFTGPRKVHDIALTFERRSLGDGAADGREHPRAARLPRRGPSSRSASTSPSLRSARHRRAGDARGRGHDRRPHLESSGTCSVSLCLRSGGSAALASPPMAIRRGDRRGSNPACSRAPYGAVDPIAPQVLARSMGFHDVSSGTSTRATGRCPERARSSTTCSTTRTTEGIQSRSSSVAARGYEFARYGARGGGQFASGYGS